MIEVGEWKRTHQNDIPITRDTHQQAPFFHSTLSCLFGTFHTELTQTFNLIIPILKHKQFTQLLQDGIFTFFSCTCTLREVDTGPAYGIPCINL